MSKSRRVVLIVEGRVKVSTLMEDGSQTVTGIFGADEFLGELVLVGNHAHRVHLFPFESKKGAALVQPAPNRITLFTSGACADRRCYSGIRRHDFPSAGPR
jgi:CRP-like cAMP-binding protein